MKKSRILILFVFVWLALSIFLPFTTNAQEAARKVQLQVPFPGVNEITVCEASGGVSECNGIANYVKLAYEWTVGFALILSVLLLTYAGLVWMTARGDKGQIQRAQGIIKNTLVGLVLAVGSYLILSVISPNLVQLQSIALSNVRKIDLSIQQQTELAQEYERAAEFPPGQQTLGICRKIMQSGLVADYQRVGQSAGVPWEVLAAIHYRENNNKARGRGRDPSGDNPFQFDPWDKFGADCTHWIRALECAAEKQIKGRDSGLSYATTEGEAIKRAFKHYNGGNFYVLNDPDNGVIMHIKGSVEGPGGSRIRIDRADPRPGAYPVFLALKGNCQ